MINYDLTKIKTVIFDVDGVLSRQTITLSAAGEPLRTVNIQDGYSIQLAQKLGLRIAIITGGTTSKRCQGAGRLHRATINLQDIVSCLQESLAQISG